MTPARPTVAFDHHSPSFREDPEGHYRELRETCPVAWTDSYDGFWITTRYADIARIARDDETFSSDRGEHPAIGTAIVIPRGPGIVQYPIEADPPKSTPYRDLVNPLLAKGSVAAMVPLIERTVREVMDSFVESGQVDFVKQFTNPVPTNIIGEWIGFPEEEWEAIAGPVHDIFSAAPGSERGYRGGMALGWLEQRMRQLLTARRAEPADDVISYLVTQSDADGRPFTDDELVSVMFLLIAGGVDTTTSLTGSTLVYLSQHPEDRERLIREPELLEIATEEFLRKFAPSQSMARTVMADTEVGTCPVPKGERVLIPWAAANHDPEMYPDPDRVLLDRQPRTHLSFGIGSHRCAGAHLARAMFKAMITEVLTRIPDYVVGTTGLEKNESVGNQAGWDAIPARFTPGPRLGRTAVRRSADAFESRTVRIEAVTAMSDDVVALTMADPHGTELPPWQPGAHVDLVLPSGKVRQYSLCGDPADLSAYRVAVLREPTGRGGSVEVHESLHAGVTIDLRGPRNHFRMVDAPSYHFVAGGIGITPILAMVRDVHERGLPWTLTYGGRSRQSMAFVEELLDLDSDRVALVPQDALGHPDLPAILGSLPAGTAVYCCGPEGLLAAVERASAEMAEPVPVYFERFTPPGGDRVDPLPDDAVEFEVVLARTGRTVTVSADRTLLDVVRDVVPGVPYDCEEGYCGSCETRVISGTPQHRDTILSENERQAGATMMICVGRCSSRSLTLDL
ncbi:MAG: cytochrome P450 [Candidatus Nanopelagicales bacterium]|nr:cytochrome P450 [Candidatus Nanopelagicales bacterium]